MRSTLFVAAFPRIVVFPRVTIFQDLARASTFGLGQRGIILRILLKQNTAPLSVCQLVYRRDISTFLNYLMI